MHIYICKTWSSNYISLLNVVNSSSLRSKTNLDDARVKEVLSKVYLSTDDMLTS